MKIRTIRTATALVSTSVAIVAAVLCFVFTGSWLYTIAICLGAFAASYVLGYYVMRKFVIYRLKPIYQIVLSKGIKTREMEHIFGYHANMQSIEGQITDWAETNRREIERLKENEKYRKDYIGNVSHELKTPIFNIQGYILTLLDGGLEDPNINRNYLERTEKSIDRLINIVTDLEQISKLESGVLKLNLERFDIVALAQDAMEAVEMDAQRKNITIALGNSEGEGNFSAQPIYVRADKHHVSQVLINLLTNSIKYGNEGGHTRISFIDLFDKIMIEVSDNGVGIAKDDIPRVFERFYRTDKSRSREQGGTGLGLSIVKHIVEAHNETITLRSELGKGSTFAFTLSKT